MNRLSGGANIFRASVEQCVHRPLVAIVAGEASGDLHGANLIRAIRQLEREISFVGLGGPRMAAQGVRTLVPADQTAVVGLSEVAKKIGNIAKAYRKLGRVLRQQRPCLLILIDFPEFNLKMASKAKKLAIPIMYYVSPQVWAWRSGRVKRIASVVDRMVCILPFEKKFYEDRGVPVDYVGHPILDALPERISPDGARKKFGVEEAYPVIAVVPGSREHEIHRLLPPMLRALNGLSSRYPRMACLLPLAPTIVEQEVATLIKAAGVPVRICREDIYQVLACCDCAMVSSGTATLEAAVMDVPMVVAYKVSALSFFLAKHLVKVDHISLVNLVAGYEVVPELIQDEVSSEHLQAHVISILEDGKVRQEMFEGLRVVRERLGQRGASHRAAQIALEMLRKH